MALAALVTPATQGQTFTVLHSFSGQPDRVNSGDRLVKDSAGNLYGTTYYGGKWRHFRRGTVFKVDASGNLTVLHNFAGTADGAYPSAGLVQDSVRNLFDTASNGFGTASNGGASGYGTVFKITFSDPSR